MMRSIFRKIFGGQQTDQEPEVDEGKDATLSDSMEVIEMPVDQQDSSVDTPVGGCDADEATLESSGEIQQHEFLTDSGDRDPLMGKDPSVVVVGEISPDPVSSASDAFDEDTETKPAQTMEAGHQLSSDTVESQSAIPVETETQSNEIEMETRSTDMHAKTQSKDKKESQLEDVTAGGDVHAIEPLTEKSQDTPLKQSAVDTETEKLASSKAEKSELPPEGSGADLAAGSSVDGPEKVKQTDRGGHGDAKTDSAKDKGRKEVSEEKEPEDYIQYITEMSANGRLIPPKQLMYKVGYMSNVDSSMVEKAVISQYKIAAERQYFAWAKDARFYGELLFAGSWLDEHMPPLGQKNVKRNKNKQRSRQRKQKINEQRMLPPGTMCQDVRLLDNPDMQVVKENAVATDNSAGDQNSSPDTHQPEPAVPEKLDTFVSDYTSNVIEQAMKQAILDGLSESTIMEVIEDVMSVPQTPGKKKLATVDLTRTPREPVDQLAVGFNYHSDILAKDSPRMEALMECSTPRRRNRDQLAVGFNYHSDEIAKNSPRPETNGHAEDVENTKTIPEQNNNVTPVKKHNTSVLENMAALTPRSRKDLEAKFAVGFSYNSSVVMETEDLVNGNASHGDDHEELVQGLAATTIQDSVDSVVVSSDKLPAGSVW